MSHHKYLIARHQYILETTQHLRWRLLTKLWFKKVSPKLMWKNTHQIITMSMSSRRLVAVAVDTMTMWTLSTLCCSWFCWYFQQCQQQMQWSKETIAMMFGPSRSKWSSSRHWHCKSAMQLLLLSLSSGGVRLYVETYGRCRAGSFAKLRNL